LDPGVNPIPDDLARAQQQWRATARRLIHLSDEVLFHPYWQGRRSAGWAALHGARHAPSAP
jgi:hypothetical protein